VASLPARTPRFTDLDGRLFALDRALTLSAASSRSRRDPVGALGALDAGGRDFHAALAVTARARGILALEAIRVEAITADSRGAQIETSPGAIPASIVVIVGSRVRRAMGVSLGDLRAQALEVDTERLPGEPHDELRFDAIPRDFSGYSALPCAEKPPS
jgi:hypothetical protein